MSAPLTIAHVDAERGFSGGEVQVFLLMEGLRERGHASVLFCPPGSESEREAKERALPTHPVPLRSDLDLGSILSLWSGFRERAVDLVHLHTGRATWLGGLAARGAGLPALTTRRMDRRVRRGWRTRLIYEHLVQRAVAISPAVADCLAEGGVDRTRTSTIPSAVDPSALIPVRGREALRAELGLASEAVVFLSLVSLVRRKGIDVLLEACRRVRSERAVFLVAGEGPEREGLERAAREARLGERLRFLGRREDKADLLAAADALVLPSRREGLGVAALEAMAVGRAVVASRVGGLAEAVVDGRTGLLVEPEDAAGLAAALDRLAGDDELRRSLGRAGPGRVGEGFLPKHMVASYEGLYRQLLEGPR